jgi:hypothetical protein
VLKIKTYIKGTPLSSKSLKPNILNFLHRPAMALKTVRNGKDN